MTRYVMVADLRRCVGCQTCTAACKEGNGTPPGVQWRRVLDLETGTYPQVSRVFVPVGCQHCANPPCMEVCPSTATQQRADGIVTIDYDLCIGCSYCVMACPYDARSVVDRSEYAFGDTPTAAESARTGHRTVGVASKCTFCAGRIDAGTARGLVPGKDPEATPLCVNSCISGALAFGDIDDPTGPVATLLAENQWFRMHESEGTEPGFYYIWDKGKL
ncbi:MAG: 4Fe-4S dicluster domain-containing protein [Rhodospirillales bacterium]|nr:4Fe-4S dicluster domain-containing protein [Rhodospirillales bacterium]